MSTAQPVPPPQRTRPPQPLEVTKVSAHPRLMEIIGREPVVVTFHSTHKATAELRIRDQWERTVRSIAVANVSVGENRITWDGRDDMRKLCRGHWFAYSIHLRGFDGQTATYDESARGAGQELKPRKFTFDSKTGLISYVLPRPAMVRIRVGLVDGPLMRTLVDWAPRLAGVHEMIWDGRDSSGSLELTDHPKLNINLAAYALPRNCILISQDAGETAPNEANSTGKLTVRPGSSKGSYLHWKTDPTYAREPRFTASFPNARMDGDGVPMVSGRVPIRIEIAPRDLPHLVSTRFETMLFVDGVYVFEEEDATSPLTYYWDTKGLAPGKHFVTVNIVSYDDHLGTVTHPVIVGGD